VVEAKTTRGAVGITYVPFHNNSSVRLKNNKSQNKCNDALAYIGLWNLELKRKLWTSNPRYS